jgi:hypothetical protein
MATYSFIDVQASITGPGGSFQLGYGSGTAEEGITVEMVADKNVMSIGSDGTPMHSLKATKAATFTIHLQKTSPTNQQLSILYNLQTSSSSLHGKNVISIREVATGDVITGALAAFKKLTNIGYATEGGMNTWAFDVGVCNTILGPGDNSNVPANAT